MPGTTNPVEFTNLEHGRESEASYSPDQPGPSTAGLPGAVDEVAGNLARVKLQCSLIDLPMVISIQSLLAQFAHSQVRADLDNRKFGLNVNSNLLPAIDELRWTLFPRWTEGGFGVAESRSREAAQHMQHLLAKDDQIFITGQGTVDQCLTYSEWYTTLETLAIDRYWSRTDVQSRCTHILPSESGAEQGISESTDNSRSVIKRPIKREFKENQCRRMVLSTKSRGQLMTNAPSRKVKDKVDEIVIFSTEPSSSDNSEKGYGGGISSDEADFQSRPVARCQGGTCTSKHDTRELVAPPKFKSDDTTSLKDFLYDYERFFALKYRGNSHDQTQKLADYLEGDMLTVFKHRGGKKLPYEKMKQELLDYYKKHKSHGRRHWRRELSDASPELDEKLDLYGLRIMQMAELAYPDDKKECALQLRQHFMASISPSISQMLQGAERSMRANSGGKAKRMAFSNMMLMAKDFQNDLLNEKKAVMWATEDGETRDRYRLSRDRERHPNSLVQEFPGKQAAITLSEVEAPSSNSHTNQCCQHSCVTREFVPQGARNPIRRRGERQSNDTCCSHCGNPSHFRRDCWKASGLCLICGKRHHIQDCPKYDPNYRNRSKSRDQRRPGNGNVSQAMGGPRDQ